MSLVWRGVISRLGRRRRWWTQAARRAVTSVLAVAAFVLETYGASQRGTGSRDALMAAGVPLAVAAIGWRVWRAPEEGLPDALRLRRRSRRIALRLASAAALGSSVGLVVGVAAHGAGARDAGAAALWLLVATPVPVLVEVLLWRLVPRRLRLAVRADAVAEVAQRLSLRIPQHVPLVFDPALGPAGRVAPRHHVPVQATFGAPCEATPHRRQAWLMSMDDAFTAKEEDWLRCASIRWTGRNLRLTDGCGETIHVPLRPDGRGTPGQGRPLEDRPVELVWLREQSYGMPGFEVRILLLDAEGRRLLTMPGLGLADKEVGRVATAARLAFSHYDLTRPDFEYPWRSLPRRMFPRRRGHVRLRLGARGQGSITGGAGYGGVDRSRI